MIFCYSLSLSFLLFLTPLAGLLAANESLTQQIQVLTACMSMTYPPRKQAPPDQDTEYGELGGLLDEEVPAAGAHVNCYDLVHFDIDPQNVFIFDTDEDHRQVPVFKVCFSSFPSPTSSFTFLDPSLSLTPMNG